MIASTAKVLLFIALSLGPRDPSLVYATSESDGFVMQPAVKGSGWTVVAQGFPASDFTRLPSETGTFDSSPTPSSVPSYLRPVARHNWSHDSAMVFDNGDRVEKHGDHAFYIINAGGPNEKVYTILFTEPKSAIKGSCCFGSSTR
jgi:hypothetical protein